jgi:hypothetical protein
MVVPPPARCIVQLAGQARQCKQRGTAAAITKRPSSTIRTRRAVGGQRSDLLRKLLGCAAARCSGAVPWCCSTACCSLPSSRPAHASPGVEGPTTGPTVPPSTVLSAACAALVALHASRWLPAAACPRRLDVLEHLPLTPSGKIDRNALAHSSWPRSKAATTGWSQRVPREGRRAACSRRWWPPPSCGWAATRSRHGRWWWWW